MTERPPSKNAWLRMSPLPRVIGVVCIVVGGVWLMQGVGVAKGSVMTGSTVWAVLGALALVAGAIVLQRALRTAKQAIANDSSADGSAPPPAEPPVI